MINGVSQWKAFYFFTSNYYSLTCQIAFDDRTIEFLTYLIQVAKMPSSEILLSYLAQATMKLKTHYFHRLLITFCKINIKRDKNSSHCTTVLLSRVLFFKPCASTASLHFKVARTAKQQIKSSFKTYSALSRKENKARWRFLCCSSSYIQRTNIIRSINIQHTCITEFRHTIF